MAENFSWAAAADVGGGLLGGANKALAAYGQWQTAKTNAEIKETMRVANNNTKREQLGLAATIRGINNTRIMEAASSHLDTLTTNAVRASDSFVSKNFEGSIRASEAMGAASARAAASGLGGAGIAAISQTVQLQHDRMQQAVDAGQGQALFDQAQNTKSVYSNALRGLDQTPLVLGANQNPVHAPSMPNLAGYLIDGLLSKADSAKVALGSLGGKEPATSPQATFNWQEATTSPVVDRSVSTVNLDPLVDTSYTDTERLLGRYPTPYANSIDAQLTRN